MNKQEVIKLLNSNNIQPKKKYGQNFFINQELLIKVIEQLNLKENSNILEIGSGFGALTEVLVNKFNRVFGVEIDSDLFSYLEKKYNDSEKIQISNNDILKINIQEIESFLGNQIIVIANIPYNITTDIILRLLPLNIVTEMAILLQLDVAEKFINNRIDTASIATIKYYGEIEMVTKISNQNFYPVPNVDSAFIKIKKKPVLQNVALEEFFKRAFSQKRKMLRNNLLKYYPNIEKVLIESCIKLNARIEELSLEQIINLFNKLEGNLK